MNKAVVGTRAFSPLEASRILAVIPHNSVQGLRDYAMLLTALATGKRIRETLEMRREDTVDLPGTVQRAIVGYLKASGRIALTENEVVFTSLVDSKRGLRPEYFLWTLKRYTEAAGMDPEQVGPGSWRATGLMIQMRPGGLARFLETLEAQRADGTQNR